MKRILLAAALSCLIGDVAHATIIQPQGLPLVGGALTGPLTGTTLNFTGTGAVGGTLTLGAGGSGGQKIQASGTGNWVLQLGGSSSLFNFTNSAGSPFLQMGGAGNGITTFQTVTLSAPNVWSGTGNAGAAAILLGQAYSGSITGGTERAPVVLQMSADTITSPSTGIPVVYVNHQFGGGTMTNGRFGIDITQTLTATSGNAIPGNGYTAIRAASNALANDNGSGLTPGTASATAFGGNFTTHLGPSATFFAGAVGVEIDTWLEAGSSVMDKIGMQIVQINNDLVQGARDDVALAFNNQAVPGVGTAGWKQLIGVGRQGGASPLDPTAGWVMAFVPTLGVGTIAGAGGLDFTNFVPVTAFMRGNNFLLDPSGNFTAASYKVGANKVVGARDTGWAAMTGTPDKASAFATSSVTLAQLAGRVMSMQAALTTHGLMGP
jgi:hypothetical protein